jgi:hypothetical protein
VPNPRPDEAVVFEDFFVAGLHMPPHLVLLDILRKFRVQLHQLTSNTIVHISKFIWAVTSCGGRPTADVFAQHYELHYQNKKIQLEGSESTLVAQFAYITFHPSRFGNRASLTPAVRNKWTSGWDGKWFYCQVPLEQTADVRGKGTYLLSCTMALLNYATEVTFECSPADADVAAFTESASIIGGRDIVEEFLACGLWPLSEKFFFKVETKETPLSKVVVRMRQVTLVIGAQELGSAFEVRIAIAACLLVGNYNIVEHNAYQGIRHGRLNRVFELAGELCQPHPEPIVRKQKAVAPVPPPQKTGKR